MTVTAGSMALFWYATLWGDAFSLPFPGVGWCTVVGIVLAVIGIIGGFMAVMRRLFPVAMIGAVCSMLAYGFFGTSFMIGLFAVILLAVSKDAFTPVTAPAYPQV
jgi:hypothetical protein